MYLMYHANVGRNLKRTQVQKTQAKQRLRYQQTKNQNRAESGIQTHRITLNVGITLQSATQLDLISAGRL